MVVRTSSLNSLKRFLPQIHQPLLLDARESQRLLDSIKNSFRKVLDKEHPWETNDGPTTQGTKPQKGNSTLSNPVPTSPLSSDTSSHQRPTDSHLRTILSHPLFQSIEHTKSVEAPQDPFKVFDYATSRGMMTPRRATGFLVKVQSQIKAAEPPNKIRQAMADSDAGLRVVQWLRASGAEHELHLLPDSEKLFCYLIPFMYAEGLEEIAWMWVGRLGKHMDEHGTALRGLLRAIVVRSKGWYPTEEIDLDGSYERVIRAKDILFPTRNQLVFNSFKKTWSNVSWFSTVFASDWAKPSVPLFEAFVDIGRHPLKMDLDVAHLDLHHPITPDHSAAVKYIATNVSADFELQTRRRVASLAFDTASRLKELGHTKEVSQIQHFLRSLDIGLSSAILNTLENKDSITAERYHHSLT
ncbi:hypothetical protein F4804DRAFT_322065 [Jackrogersella minutella]|nr:hypothetical protein F4804DRAFT_322065 [Jackrogersella minutella]